MSVKHAMLALLAAAPSSTYQLRKRFDASTGQGLPLNIGQVSSTLQRLERDGMVTRDGTLAASDTQATGDGAGAGQLWRLRQAGRDELASWWASPVLAEQRGRDELGDEARARDRHPWRRRHRPATEPAHFHPADNARPDAGAARRGARRHRRAARRRPPHLHCGSRAALARRRRGGSATRGAAGRRSAGADLQRAALAGTPASTDETITAAQPAPLSNRVEGTQ